MTRQTKVDSVYSFIHTDSKLVEDLTIVRPASPCGRLRSTYIDIDYTSTVCFIFYN